MFDFGPKKLPGLSRNGPLDSYIFVRGLRKAYKRNRISALKRAVAVVIKIRFAFTSVFNIMLQNIIINQIHTFGRAYTWGAYYQMYFLFTGSRANNGGLFSGGRLYPGD